MVTRNALLYLSRHEGLKDFATRFSPFKKMTARFVAGEDIEETIAAIRRLNAAGCTASFDHLNESVTRVSETEEEVREYLKILARIDETGINSNVSIKLTQFGLDIDPELAYRNARAVVEEAARRGNFVRVDMEDSRVTEVTLDIFRRLRAEFGLDDVGIVVQSYLRRTYGDVQELLKIPARIRLCKGAYNEPPEVAFPDKKDVDDNYVRCMKVLLSSGTYHGIATHDERMIEATDQPRAEGRHRQGRLRVPDALRHPPRPRTEARARRLPPARLRALRQALVSLLHAAARRAPGERLVHPEEPAQRLAAGRGRGDRCSVCIAVRAASDRTRTARAAASGCPTPTLPAARRRHSKTPAEKMSMMLTFSAINAALALFSAIALYATYLGREEARWSIYVAASFCLVIAVHQTISLVLNLQLRSRLARGRAAQAPSPAPPTDVPAARALDAADDKPFADVRSVTENTTELLAGVPRAGGSGGPK